MTDRAKRRLGTIGIGLLVLGACSSGGGDDTTGEVTTTTASSSSTSTVATPSSTAPAVLAVDVTDQQLVDLVGAATALHHEVQREAVLSATVLAGGRSASAELDEQRDRTDAAIDAYRPTAAALPADSAAKSVSDLVAATAAADEQLEALVDTRDAIDGRDLDATEATTALTAGVRSLMDVTDEARIVTKDPELANRILEVLLVDRILAPQAEIAALLAAATEAGELTDEDLAALRPLRGQRDTASQTFESLGSAGGKAALREGATGKAALNEAVAAILDTPPGDPLPMSNEELREVAGTYLDQVVAVEADLIAALL